MGRLGSMELTEPVISKSTPQWPRLEHPDILGIVHRIIRQPRCDHLRSGVELCTRTLSVFFSLAPFPPPLKSELVWTAAGTPEESVFSAGVCVSGLGSQAVFSLCRFWCSDTLEEPITIDSRGVRHDVVRAWLRIAPTYSWNVSSACTFLLLPLKTS